MDTSNGLVIPSAKLGSGMYDFGYTTQQLPTSEVAFKASQLDSGGSGFDWSSTVNGIKDLAGVWLTIESHKNNWAGDPTPQMRAEDGKVYPVGQTITPQPEASGLNTKTMMIMAGVVVAAVLIARA